MEAGNLPSEMVSFGKCCWGQLLLGLLNSTIEVMVSKNNNKKKSILNFSFLAFVANPRQQFLEGLWSSFFGMPKHAFIQRNGW